VNLAVHFIRAKSSLILTCSSNWFPIYTPFSERWGRMKQGMVGQRSEEGGARIVMEVVTC